MFDEMLPVSDEYRQKMSQELESSTKKKENLAKANNVLDRMMKDAEARRLRKEGLDPSSSSAKRKSRDKRSTIQSKKASQFSVGSSARKTYRLQQPESEPVNIETSQSQQQPPQYLNAPQMIQ
mmetsp:Transcript_9394/g.14331  ORF Transcript_9394/g.14331 Transcript_9394/m.14331 type:complete len:123 (-) Transcript_9394:304-672(-)